MTKATHQPSKEPHQLSPGEYCYFNGTLYARTPVVDHLVVANLSSHKVVKNQDGTITVSPSILVKHHAVTWHGYLEHDVWREC